MGPVGFLRTVLEPSCDIHTVFFQIDTGMEIRIGGNAFNMDSLLVSSSIANVSRLGCARSFCMFFCMMISVRFCMRCLIGSHAQIQALDPARNPGQNPA